MNRTGCGNNVKIVRMSLLIIFAVVLCPSVLFGQIIQGSPQFIFLSDANFSSVVGAGARAFGMGGAFIAVADDATAASWNPGGLGQLEKPEVSFVLRVEDYRKNQPASFDIFTENFLGPQDKDGNTYGFDFLSVTYPLHIGKFKLVPQISYQRSVSFDLRTRMNDVQFSLKTPAIEPNGPFVFKGLYSESDKFKGGIDMVSISLGTKIRDRISVGVSTNIFISGFTGNSRETWKGKGQYLDDPDSSIYFTQDQEEVFTTHFKGFNFNFGVLIDLTERFKVGAVYKNAANITMDYTISSKMSTAVNETLGSSEESSVTHSSKLRWPQTFGVGVSYRPSDPLTLSFDFTYTRSSKEILYDFKLPDSEKTTDYYFPLFYEVQKATSDQTRQIDSMQIRGGMEYIFITPRKLLIPVRFGLFGDNQYFTDSSGKRVTMFGLTGGFGISKGALSVDTAILYEFGNYLRDNLDYAATLASDIKIYLSAIYRF